jgi:carbon-monoxide dehydrogenase medium subunit
LASYQYFQPNSVSEVIELLRNNQEEAHVLAGGTDLMVQIKEGIKVPEVLVDITKIKELQEINVGEKWVEIGATATHAQLNEELKEVFPVLSEAAGEVGSPQIRNQGTIGGNLSNGSPAADTVPALYVLGAEAVILNGAGTRRTKVWDLPLGPGKLDLKKDEIITKFLIPKTVDNEAAAFVKVGKRKALAIAIVNAAVCVAINPEENVFTKARIAIGSVAPTTKRLREVEEILVGEEVCDETLDKAQEKTIELVKPITDIRGTEEYRKKVTGGLVRKGLEKVLAQL